MVMVYFVLFFAMVFCHIVDDYYLQGWLASAKKQKWWETNCPSEKYKDDWVAALLCHSLSWSFMINLPLIVFSLYTENTGVGMAIFFCLSYSVNAIIHMIVDHLKANVSVLNLWQDQLIHLHQLVITYALFLNLILH